MPDTTFLVNNYASTAPSTGADYAKTKEGTAIYMTVRFISADGSGCRCFAGNCGRPGWWGFIRACSNYASHRLKGELTMAWIILLIAGLFETGWAVGLKYTDGFTRLWPSVWTVLAMTVSFVLLSYAMKFIPLGTAYAVWVGIGALGTLILGIYLFNEPANAGRLISAAFILIGIIGLKLTATA